MRTTLATFAVLLAGCAIDTRGLHSGSEQFDDASNVAIDAAVVVDDAGALKRTDSSSDAGADAGLDAGVPPPVDAGISTPADDAGSCDVTGRPCTDCAIRSVGNNCCSGACLCSGISGMCQ